jgi:multiple sugar transport system substrate-binding protein
MSSVMTRRTFLMSGAAGLAVAYGLGGCGHNGASGRASRTVTFGSNYSDPIPRHALQVVLDRFRTSSGIKVDVNTVDSDTFQEQINDYLQGTPDDVFTWFAGDRMRFFAARGLATDISDVWERIGDDFSGTLKQASTGLDGKQYLVPFYDYPWAMFYRRRVFEAHGWAPPTTLDDFKALCAEIRTAGLTPLAFGDKDGWPAMGYFDYINLRTNGYAFHKSLLAGERAWDGPQVKAVFRTWRELLPYYQKGSLGRTWQDAAQSLKNDSAMYLLGLFVGQQLEGQAFDDLDFFQFPEINPDYGQDAIEAPIDGFMLSGHPKNEAAGKALLEYLAGAGAQNTYLESDPHSVAANHRADTSNYTALQVKAKDAIAGAKQISQYLDRDTRPDFASTVMIPALQEFINHPDDIDGLCSSIERQKKTIFE